MTPILIVHGSFSMVSSSENFLDLIHVKLDLDDLSSCGGNVNHLPGKDLEDLSEHLSKCCLVHS